MTVDLAARTKAWALWLTEQPSVTGSEGERQLPGRLKERIGVAPELAVATTSLLPCTGDPLGRACLVALVRGRGPETVLLTGHFDTVSTEDYGPLAPLATQPLALTEALLDRLGDPGTPAEQRARADLEGGAFWPGRGLLDMKAGLAAGLAALEAFAADPDRRGNLLFVAVPDEEVNSVGARELAHALPEIEAAWGLRVVAAINLDAIADDGDGSQGRAIALGSVGKLLLTATVIGRSAHACYPLAGLNAGALAGAIAAAVEWSPELADTDGPEAGAPPTLLSLRDSKSHYDVTTPESVFAAWNALTLGRTADAVLARFRRVVEGAVSEMRAALARRAASAGDGGEIPSVAVIEAATLLRDIEADPALAEGFRAEGERLAAAGLDLPEQCRRLTAWAWASSGRSGPAVVIGFGSLPYPAVALGETPDARRLHRALEGARVEAEALGAGSIRLTSFFPGISDMSFIGEADTAALGVVAANTPAWASGVRWSGAVGAIPTINIGPWGRDYHTPLERLYLAYGFEVVPRLVLGTARRVLEDAESSEA